ncbi:MAG TPA: sigma-54 dependent transcriptional regulator [Bdellovibrionota bacterium]|jgi:DNA-binding NtrC family response regulator
MKTKNGAGPASTNGWKTGGKTEMDSFTRKLAATQNTILITGPTGTGKSHLAREIHKASPQRNGRFVTINLATLSENLIESELFGHEKGAFSGADLKRIGKLESANGGTAFLDEIGELNPRLQTKLLEALNSHVVSPVGSNREVPLDIRVVAATNRDLRKLVKTGEFREDLYFRINTFQVELPALASTPERIPSLAAEFAVKAAERQDRPYTGMSQEFLQELKHFSWPGNLRELKNAMEFAVAMSPEGTLTPACLPSYLETVTPEREAASMLAAFPTDYRQAKSLFERSYFHEVLQRFEGRINLTAREAGLSKVTLIEKIRRYEIDVRRIKHKSYAPVKA